MLVINLAADQYDNWVPAIQAQFRDPLCQIRPLMRKNAKRFLVWKINLLGTHNHLSFFYSIPMLSSKNDLDFFRLFRTFKTFELFCRSREARINSGLGGLSSKSVTRL